MYKVLLVEDEILVRLGMRNSIPWQKYQMEVAADAEDGAAAFEKFLAIRPDLVVTDIKMNGMDGMELIRRIREQDERCAILVISCLDDFDTLHQIMKYDVLGYILKARTSISEMEELLEKARRYLEKHGPAHPPGLEVPLPAPLLQEYILNDSMEEASFSARWKALGYPPAESFGSVVYFHILPENHPPLGDLGISFILNIIGENLPESYAIRLDEAGILAVNRENLVYADIRLCRITQMVHTFFDASLRLITKKLRGGFSSLRAEARELQALMQAPAGEIAASEQIIRKAMDYLLNHCSENISLNVVAAYVGLSPNYFSALFKKATGITYVAYLNNIRVERAKFLLQSTNDYLYSVSEQAGFHTFEHFSQVFKQKTGTNPGEWRRQHTL